MPDEPQSRRIDAEVHVRATGARKAAEDLDHVKDGLLGGVLNFIRSGSAMQGVISGIGGALHSKFVGPLGIALGTVFGIVGGFKLLGAQLAMVARGVESLSMLESVEKQFLPLLKGAQAAKDRVAELYRFAAVTPFRLGEVATANKNLELLTRGGYSSEHAMTVVGDAAAVSGQEIGYVAQLIGRLYEGLKSGRPVGEFAWRLQEVGVFSNELVTKLERLSESGADFGTVWAAVEADLARSKGAMKGASETLEGLRSTLEDTRDQFAGSFGKPFLDAEKQSIRATAAVLEAATPAAREFADVFAFLKIPLSATVNKFTEFMFTMKEAPSVIAGAATAMAALTAAMGGAAIGRGIGMLQEYKTAVDAIAQSRAMDAAGMLGPVAKADVSPMIQALANLRAKAGDAFGIGLKAMPLWQAGLKVLGGAINIFVLGPIRAIGAALAANPIAAVLAAVAFASYKVYKHFSGIYEEVSKIADATREHHDAMEEAIRTASTMEDKQRAILTAQRKLVESQRELNRLRAEGKDSKIVEAQERQVSDRELMLRRAKGIRESGLTGYAGDIKAMQERARMEREIADMARSALIDRLTGESKLAALKREQLELEQRAATARKAEAATKRLGPAQEIADAELKSADEKIKAAEAKIKAATTTVRTGSIGYNPVYGAVQGTSTTITDKQKQAEGEAELAAARKAKVDAFIRKQELALNSESAFQRAQAENALIDIKFKKNRSAEEEAYFQKNAGRVANVTEENRGAEQTKRAAVIDEAPEAAKLEAAAAQKKFALEVAQIDEQAATAKEDAANRAAREMARVVELGVAGARREADIRKQAMLEQQEIARRMEREKWDAYVRHLQAQGKQVSEEEKAEHDKTVERAEQARAAEREALDRENREREHAVRMAGIDKKERLAIAEETAEARFGKGSFRKAQTMQDTKDVKDRSVELAKELAISAAEAQKLAMREKRADLLGQAQLPEVVADSLQAVGGGGNTFNGGTDPVLAVNMRMEEIQRNTLQVQTAILDATRTGPTLR